MGDRRDLGAPEGSPMIEVDGVRLAVAREGKGPPLVCLHAIGHGGRDFEVLTAAVKGRFEVIRVDWPGQGRSDEDLAHPAGPARYARLLEGLLDKLGIERPLILGNSIGGAAAIVYASRHPVRGLVLCDTGGLVAVDATARRFTGAFARFFAAGARGAWWYPAVFRLYYSQVLSSPAARGQRDRMNACCRELAPLLQQAWTSFGQAENDLRDKAVALDCPVWFAWARSDRVIPIGFCQATIDAMRHASVTHFKGGHSPFLEQPEAFIPAFERFADSLSPAAPRLALAG